ncbi:MAG: ABC transporter ATP-binding protein [Eubacteriales bacterium]|nr:ABC transporter ATP-binding protein [Eubacteriales bacterium]
MSESAISAEHLNKVYKLYNRPSDRLKEVLGRKVGAKENYALKDVNFTVNKGETVGIIGTNGSGKSTLLKIITGVASPTSGSVKVNGRISALLELGAGFNYEYSGVENVYLNGTMIGFSKEEIDERLDDILKFADIGDYVYQPVKTYSSGMFVRLAFAVAINIDPEILIVDEALSVGDVFFQAKCYRKFDEFKKKGKTIVFVSHDLGAISRYCDRVLLLNKGVVMDEGTPKEMVDLYKQLLVKRDKEKPEGSRKVQAAGDGFERPFAQNPEALEYGEKEAEIIDFTMEDASGTPTNTFEKMTEFVIRMKVYFHEEVEDPIYAFTIKDMRGTEITGTNTMYEKTVVGKKNPGDVQMIEFRQKMNLQGGEYLLSLGCTGYAQGEFRAYHRLYDICSINVVAAKNTVGFYDMDSAVTVTDVREDKA